MNGIVEFPCINFAQIIKSFYVFQEQQSQSKLIMGSERLKTFDQNGEKAIKLFSPAVSVSMSCQEITLFTEASQTIKQTNIRHEFHFPEGITCAQIEFARKIHNAPKNTTQRN